MPNPSKPCQNVSPGQSSQHRCPRKGSASLIAEPGKFSQVIKGNILCHGQGKPDGPWGLPCGAHKAAQRPTPGYGPTLPRERAGKRSSLHLMQEGRHSRGCPQGIGSTRAHSWDTLCQVSALTDRWAQQNQGVPAPLVLWMAQEEQAKGWQTTTPSHRAKQIRMAALSCLEGSTSRR